MEVFQGFSQQVQDQLVVKMVLFQQSEQQNICGRRSQVASLWRVKQRTTRTSHPTTTIGISRHQSPSSSLAHNKAFLRLGSCAY